MNFDEFFFFCSFTLRIYRIPIDLFSLARTLTFCFSLFLCRTLKISKFSEFMEFIFQDYAVNLLMLLGHTRTNTRIYVHLLPVKLTSNRWLTFRSPHVMPLLHFEFVAVIYFQTFQSLPQSGAVIVLCNEAIHFVRHLCTVLIHYVV